LAVSIFGGVCLTSGGIGDGTLFLTGGMLSRYAHIALIHNAFST